MKGKFLIPISALAVVACTQNEKNSMYPDTRKGDVVDEYFGTQVEDPYRWLEDDMSEETADWVARQNEVSFAFLDSIPYRQALVDRITELWNYEKFSAPFERGEYIYWYKNDGLQNHSVLYRKKGEDGPTEVFLDPNSFSEDGTTSLAGMSFTKDGSLVAYQISEAGSDWRKVIILEAETGRQLEDTLMDVKFSGLSWRGTEGFYYSSYDKPEEGSALSGMTQYHKLFFHKLGTPQEEDELIFGGEEAGYRYIGGGVSEDQTVLAISAAKSTSGNNLFLLDLTNPEADIVQVTDDLKFEQDLVHVHNGTLYISTNRDAPNRRLVSVSMDDPSPENWVDVIPEREEVGSYSTGGGYIFGNYLKDALSHVEQFTLNGESIRTIELPGPGDAGGFGAKWDADHLYYSFSNYINPSTTFKYDIETGESELYKRSAVAFNPDEYTSEQVFYQSKDGTRVPMIITYKKGLKMDGSNPTMLYGYGGFNISLTPSFSTARIPWLENGGIWAVANLRGGGEYGEEWHTAGTQMQKQNVFDDFIAAAEFLMAEGYTSKEKLAIRGGSNGGLLVGAVMTQRPDLCQVALPAVGVLDMLRYHTFTAGAGWAYDYGTSEDSEEMFKYLLGYSPYHNIDKACYPATMVTTGDHDDRVVPAHSFKFAARLQEMQQCENPTLIRISVNAGHGAGKPTSMIIQEQADVWAFAFWNMGITSLDQ
ncbi:prolyl oligopeptidase family serine peptidase [Phaeocystidibacter luteus]|uniref:prolyl oligopeptidase n=1 Tax=Phaeocystidibacter luteus TaxID=911197 RepID=A0A6N6RGC4_9FLAO|nr:prolyl oligopeptidase family serine peptidase [Phaeocystidibacter luteus]KAB2810200.1 S9 family peptidase [Phaeocystidibacter luteus]